MHNAHRIAVITTSEHPCAKYLSAKLVENGVDVLLVSQNESTYKYLSHDSLFRLLRRRGIIVFLDNWFLKLSKIRILSRVLRRFPILNGKYVSKEKHKFKIWDDETWKPALEKMDVMKVTRVNSPETVATLEEYKPSLILLAGAPIISDEIINLSQLGTINPHYGITPRYAGNSPYIWALFENRPNEIGYTIHFALPQVDSGAVIEQKRMPWRTDWSWDVLDKYLLQAMYDRLVAVSMKIISGEDLKSKNQQVDRTYPPAGYFTRIIAEKHKAKIFANGTILVNKIEGEDEIDKYLINNFIDIL